MTIPEYDTNDTSHDAELYGLQTDQRPQLPHRSPQATECSKLTDRTHLETLWAV
jgi:hypothetical protein